MIARRLLTLAGVGMLAFGLAGLLRHADETKPGNWVVFFVGGLVAHDAVLVPTVMVLALGLSRLVPRRVRPVVQGTAIVAAALVVVAIPVLTGNGRLGNNPSILPQDYGAGLLTALAVLAALAVVLVVRALLRPAPPAPPEPPPLPPRSRAGEAAPTPDSLRGQRAQR